MASILTNTSSMVALQTLKGLNKGMAKVQDEISTGLKISKATVYNTLNLFAARGLVRHLNVEASHASFDSNIRPHFHFHVVDTGELIDVPPGDVEFASLPEPPRGTEIAGVDVVLRLRRNG